MAVDGVLLPGPEHDAGDADGRVGVRRRAGAAAASRGEGAGGGRGGSGRGAARAAGGGGGGEAPRRGVAAEEAAPAPARAQPGRELVAAVPGPRRRLPADVAGRVPGHGAAARGGRLPLRRHRRLGAGGRGGGHRPVRGRQGAAAAVLRRGGGAREVAAAAGVGGLVIAGASAGAAHRHLQRRRGVTTHRSTNNQTETNGAREIAIKWLRRGVHATVEWTLTLSFNQASLSPFFLFFIVSPLFNYCTLVLFAMMPF
jgi:hypothetical protein